MQRREQTTFFHERWRAVASGVIETAGTTFLILIAVRAFEAGATAKALIAGAGSFGLLLSPVTVACVAAGQWRISKAAAFLSGMGAACFLLAAAVPILSMFVACSVVGMAVMASMIPLLTQMYHENYPESDRGGLFSKTMMIRMGMAVVFAQLAGSALTGRIGHFPWLLLVYAAAFAWSAYCLARCPTRPLRESDSANPFHALRFVKEDRLFRWTLITWMLMGFANLMMLPMRVEYLANPRYGLHLDAAKVAMFTSVIPNIARLIMSPMWGWLFDRMNFFVLRVVLNLGFAAGILAFFTGDTTTGFVLGAVIFGVSNAGGDVAWSLWVTKFAPPGRVADYMSVHTFLTGIRGVLAPMLAFHIVAHLSMGALAAVSAVMIVVASLLLLREVKHGKSAPRRAALVEEISE